MDYLHSCIAELAEPTAGCFIENNSTFDGELLVPYSQLVENACAVQYPQAAYLDGFRSCKTSTLADGTAGWFDFEGLDRVQLNLANDPAFFEVLDTSLLLLVELDRYSYDA